MSIDRLGILLVEADPNEAQRLEGLIHAISRPSTEIESAEHLARALERCRERRFDAVFLDLTGPDGIENAGPVRQIQHVAPHTPIVVLVDRSQKNVAIAALERGAVDYWVQQELSDESATHTLIWLAAYADLLRKLEERPRWLALLFDSSRRPLLLVDGQGRLIEANAAAQRLLGCTRIELVGHPLGDLTPDLGKDLERGWRSFLTAPEGRIELTAPGKKEGKANVERRAVVEVVPENYLVVLGSVIPRVGHAETSRELRPEGTGSAIVQSRVEEGERRRIASELHDRTIQNLALIRLKLGELQQSFRRRGDLSLRLEEVQRLVDTTIQEIRSMIFELTPPVLHEHGLEAAIRWLTEQFEQRSGVPCVVEGDGQDKPLDDDVQSTLFQAVRELLANVQKHAKAARVTVALRTKDTGLEIQVRDDGVGFDAGALRVSGGEGFGLFDVRERLARIGGQVDIESALGAGTCITLSVPVPESFRP